MIFTDVHRAMVQLFMSRRCLKAADARQLFANILNVGKEEVAPNQVTDGAVIGYIGELNDELFRFDFEIRSMRDQHDRSTVFALVNTTSDDIIQGATPYSADEIAYFRRLLDAMFITNNTHRAEVMAVKLHDALHLNKNPRSDPSEEVVGASTQTQTQQTQSAANSGLTVKGAEDALGSFVEAGWLVRSKNNWYSLGPRGLMELGGYLSSTYNNSSSEDEDESTSEACHGDKIKNCYACKEMITVGQRCDKLTCNVRLHAPCAIQLFKTNRGRDQVCPTCKTKWTGDQLVGEKATEKLGRSKQKTAPPPPKPTQTPRRSRREATEDGNEGLPDASADGEEEGEDEDEDEDEDEELEETVRINAGGNGDDEEGEE